MNGSSCYISVCPVHGYFKVALCNQSIHTSVSPVVWNCRKKIDVSCIALQKHLSHTGCITEVTIDLEISWLMIIEQIRIDSAVEQVLDDLISFISITQSCPTVDSLCHSPSSTFICTVLHRYLCCCKPLCMILCNEVSREKSQKVGHMTVVISFSECSSTCSMVKGCLCIPFFDLSAVADLDRSFQICLVCFPCSYQICICSKDFRCFDCVLI